MLRIYPRKRKEPEPKTEFARQIRKLDMLNKLRGDKTVEEIERLYRNDRDAFDRLRMLSQKMRHHPVVSEILIIIESVADYMDRFESSMLSKRSRATMNRADKILEYANSGDIDRLKKILDEKNEEGEVN